MHKVRFHHLLSLVLAGALLPAPTFAQVDEAKVLTAARAAYGGGCTALESPPGLPEGAVQRFEVMVPAGDGMEPQPVILWQTLCQMGGSNRSFAFWVEDGFGGLQPLTFARPVVDVVLERPDDPESPVREAKVAGWAATPLLLNVAFDPATLTFADNSMARGLADAFAAGTWRLSVKDSLVQSVIQTFEVDASYDGAANPIMVYPVP